MKKRLVSLLLTLALLVLPVVSAGAAQPDPTPVQTQTEAAEAAQHQYSYIALGDSIVAGIGLPDAVYQRNGRYYDVSGNYQGYSKDCYVARVAEGLGLSRDQTANYGMPALMSGDLLELVRTGSCQSASINFSLPDLRQELKHAQVITVEIGANDVLVPIMYMEMIRLQPWPTRSSAASAVPPPSAILYFQTIWSSLMPSSAAASLMPLMCAAL